MTVDVMSGGFSGPLACELREIEGLEESRKSQILNQLVTAAEFYGYGHSAGYEDGYRDGVAAATAD